MRKFLFVLFFFLIFADVAHAESIQNFTSDITVHKDGTITVKERISYDFGYSTHRGIYRDIPYIRKNKDGKSFRLDFDVQSVKDESGRSWDYETSRTDENIRIKIGDANKYVSGIQNYIITYNVSGALTYFSDHDELYWNVTGDEWTVPIEQVSSTVTLPKEVINVTFVCYSGPSGSSEQSCTASAQNNILTYVSNNQLSPGSGLTVVAGFPKNIVAVLEPKEVVSFFDTTLGKIVAFSIAIAALWWYLIYPLTLPIKWYRQGRDPYVGIPTKAWFDPPKTKDSRPLTPAETGALVDEKVDIRDIQSTVVDLARRGYLKIVEYKKGEFRLVKGKSGPTTTPYESYFYGELFDGTDEVDLKQGKLTDVVTKTEEMIYESLVKDGFFPENPSKVRNFYLAVMGFALFTMNPLLIVTSVIFGQIMPKKTLAGAEAASVATGLKNFLTSQERQLNFQAKNQLFFEKLLPYAVAFGVEKEWAKRFKDLALRAPSWYQPYGTTHFTTAAFSNSLHSSMSKFSSAATPVRSSTGHSSGFSGGSSGGGGGGGGGGSW